ncbi:YiiD C-terminal domain-containing protein [Sulfurimonas sp. MAG313]|nr:YiiD C-terminal domain-containing protein [Sulfurimonas sp. MAG313]MDF1879907.1 YiiD C-terminal domain-containing protein [Sulfurimonas sp. MAG313]
MTIKDVPFASFIGINEGKELSLDFKEQVQNHVQTIHASAQFTLAETKSGLYLLELFPELSGKVIPLLREAKIKYKKPALQKIIAYASIEDEAIEKFKMIFEKKGRGSISLKVQIKDINDVLCSEGEFSWFIQAL